MHLQDCKAPKKVRSINGNLTIKATRTKECWIQNVRSVCCGNQDDAAGDIKAIHFNQHLVECLLALIVTAAHTCTTMTTHGINFIDKDNCGCICFGLLEKISHATSTNTHEHLNEVRSGNRKEWDSSLAGNSTGQQRLTCSRRTIEKNTLRNFGSDRVEL
ncbi:unannotated protein [freshwater metagenome]|uniref:Unannotated protein n=1 Tax=freshwater metagenome TaxID=449393 RepID=A0A6J6M3J5_9ZZZZ